MLSDGQNPGLIYIYEVPDQKGIFNKPFNYQLRSNPSPVFWGNISGLPDGLEISSSGVIQGTPLEVGNFTPQVTGSVYNSNFIPFTRGFKISIAVGAPVITPGQVCNARADLAFSQQIILQDTLNRPVGDKAWEGFFAQDLPYWATINQATGVVSGTPPHVGSFAFTVTATNATGAGSALVSILVDYGAPQLLPNQAFSLVKGVSFEGNIQSRASFEESQGSFPITNYSSSNLPVWVQLDASTGKLTATAPESGEFSFLITATGPGGVDHDTVRLEVIPQTATVPNIVSTQISANLGVVLDYTLEVSDQSFVKFWSSNRLPQGVTLNANTGRLTGTPLTTGVFPVVFTATNALGASSATITINIVAGPPVFVSQNFVGAAGNLFSQKLSATGAVSWACSSLPAWATLNPQTGQITGTPANPLRSVFTATATGGTGYQTTAQCTIDIGAKIVAPLDAGLDLTLNEIVDFTVPTITAGRSIVEEWTTSFLPPGITFSKGKFSGRATKAGSYTVTVFSKNKWDSASATITFDVAFAAPSIKRNQVLKGKTDRKISFQISLDNLASRPVEGWDAKGLPGGFQIDSSGSISGTFSNPYEGRFTVIAKSRYGEDSAEVSIQITGPFFYGKTTPVLQPGRSVKTFPSGLVAVSETYKMRPLNESTARARFAEGATLDTESTSISPLKIFPAPDFRSVDNGFVEMLVTAYGRTGGEHRRSQSRIQSAKVRNKILVVPPEGGSPVFMGSYSERSVNIFANTHSVRRTVEYQDSVESPEGESGVEDIAGYGKSVTAFTERYDVVPYGAYDEVTVTTAYEVVFTQL
jgi:hypothetical protein